MPPDGLAVEQERRACEKDCDRGPAVESPLAEHAAEQQDDRPEGESREEHRSGSARDGAEGKRCDGESGRVLRVEPTAPHETVMVRERPQRARRIPGRLAPRVGDGRRHGEGIGMEGFDREVVERLVHYPEGVRQQHREDPCRERDEGCRGQPRRAAPLSHRARLRFPARDSSPSDRPLHQGRGARRRAPALRGSAPRSRRRHRMGVRPGISQPRRCFRCA